MAKWHALASDKRIAVEGVGHIAFDPEADLVFDYGPPLPGHANGMIFRALGADGETLAEETLYSVGGGFGRQRAGTCQS